MAKPRNDFIDRLQYVGLRLVTMSLHCWPVELNLQVAKLIGDVMYAIDKRHRDRALGNLRRSFPDMPEKQRQQMARRSMQQLFMLFIEVLFTTRLVHLETLHRYVVVRHDDRRIRPHQGGVLVARTRMPLHHGRGLLGHHRQEHGRRQGFGRRLRNRRRLQQSLGLRRRLAA